MAATLWRRGHTALDYTFVHRYKFEVLQESFRPILHSLIPVPPRSCCARSPAQPSPL